MQQKPTLARQSRQASRLADRGQDLHGRLIEVRLKLVRSFYLLRTELVLPGRPGTPGNPATPLSPLWPGTPFNPETPSGPAGPIKSNPVSPLFPKVNTHIRLTKIVN